MADPLSTGTSSIRTPSQAPASPVRRDARVQDALEALGMSGETLSAPVRAALEALAAEVAFLRESLAETRAALAEAETRADTDALTRLYNRGAFERELSRHIASAARYGEPLSVLFVDLDGFKAVNDHYGHAAGDRALQGAAEALIEEMRASDAVGRLGGDEFGVILPHAALDAARAKAKQVEDRMQAAAARLGLGFAASVGAATFETGETAASLLDRADEAMFARKQARRAGR